MPSILALGSGGSGQLGIGRLEEKLGIPTPCQFDIGPPSASRVVALAGGGNHTLILFDDGTLYTAGDNKNGACGYKDLAALPIFHKIVLEHQDSATMLKFEAIAATWTSSIALTSHGRLVVFGEGANGELGLGPVIHKALTPQEIADFPPQGRRVIQLRASLGHVLVVLDDGTVWGWGASRHGQLGTDVIEGTKAIWTPKRVKYPYPESFSVQQVVCGNGFSGILGVCGGVNNRSPHGILLGGDKHRIRENLENLIPSDFDACSTWSSIYLRDTRTGTVKCVGRDANLPVAQKDFPAAELLIAGSEHTAAKLLDGRIIAWGWNEHQNCGEGYGPASSYMYNVLSEARDSRLLGCGCATTFVQL